MKPSARHTATALALVTLLSAWGLPSHAPAPLAAQESRVSYGAGLLSRYVWRGMEYSTTVQVQPWIQANLGSLELGTWGSYGIDGEYLEQSQWITWTHALPRGSLGVTVTDYYFTEDFSDFFDWGGVEDGVATGAHTLEAILAYEGPEERRVRLLLASTFYNDPGPSVYAEAGYALERVGLNWAAQVGYLLHDGGYYELGSGGLTNLTLSASRLLGTWLSREVLAASYLIHSPKLGKTHLAVEITF